MLHISVITPPTNDTYSDELVEIFLKLSMKTVQVHLIIGTTLVNIKFALVKGNSISFKNALAWDVP